MNEAEESISLPRDSRSRSKRLKSKTKELGKRTLHRLKNRRVMWEVMEELKPDERYTETPRVLTGYAKLRKSTHRRSKKKYLVLRGGMLTVYSHRDNLGQRNKEELQADLGLCSIRTNRLTRRILIDLGSRVAYYIKTTRVDYDTWIQKLKVHRLYRQDELRFGSSQQLANLEENSHKKPPLPQSRPSDPEHHSSNWLNQISAIDNKVESNRNLVRCADQLIVELNKCPKQYSDEQTENSPLKAKQSAKPKESIDATNESQMPPEIMNDFLLTANSFQPTTLVRTKSATNAAAFDTRIKSFPMPQRQAQIAPQTTIRKPKLLQSQMRPPTRTVSQPALLKPLESKPAEVQVKQIQTMPQQDDDKSEFSSSSDESTTVTPEEFLGICKRVPRVQSNDLTSTKETSPQSSPTSKENVQSPAPKENLQPSLPKKESTVPQLIRKESTKLPAPINESAPTTRKDVPQKKDTTQTTQPANVMKSPMEASPLKKSPTIRRTKLPAPQGPFKSLSIWKLLAGIARRAHHPATMHEPLNSLQLSCEELEYAYLLDEACREPDPCERIALVTAFAIARYSTTVGRGGRKPFAPLKGETYENDRWEEKEGWRLHGEQVDNYPHVSAVHAEGKAGWTWTMTFTGKMAFAGSLEFVPETTITLTLDPFNENYSWNKVKTLVHNVLQPSKCTLTHVGVMKVQCNNGLHSQVSFERDGHELVGGIFKDDQSLKELMGKWNEGLFFKGNAHKWLFKANSLPPDAHMYYGFSQFARELNEMTPELQGKLPPTDTRFRPDLRYMEQGQIDKAQEIKENKMDVRLDSKPATPPMWFVQSPQNSKAWISTRKYWTAKDAGFHNISFPTLW